MANPDRPFRINAKSFFITYPQCDLNKEIVQDWFKEKFDVIGLRVCKELHADGRPHIHVVFHLEGPFQTRNPRFFDIDGFHPNLQPTRSISASYAYIAKEGDYIDFGEIPGPTVNKWATIANAASKDEMLALAKATAPRDYVLNYEKLTAYAESHFVNRTEVYAPLFNDFRNLPQQLTDWEDQRHEVCEGTEWRPLRPIGRKGVL